MAVRRPPYSYVIEIYRVVDGDTVEAYTDLGRKTWIHDERFRLNGIQAPEMKNKPQGPAALVHLQGLLDKYADEVHDDHWTLLCRTYKDKNDKYGRLLVTLLGVDKMTGNEVDLNQQMILDGHAREYIL